MSDNLYKFPKKPNDKDKRGFFGKNGLYIIMLASMVMIGITGYISSQKRVEAPELAPPQYDEAQDWLETFTGPGATAPPEAAPEPLDINTAKAQPAAVDISADVSGEPEPTPEPPPAKITRMARPAEGEVLVPFSPEAPVFSKTLEDWRTHDAVDIKGPIGSKVVAAADGTIENVYDDPSYGITIIIDHGAGVKSIYQNLSTDELVKKGAAVSMGATISGIGESAPAEAYDEPHLHFAVEVDGKRVDPAPYYE